MIWSSLHLWFDTALLIYIAFVVTAIRSDQIDKKADREL